jgi:UDP-N-acetylmuramoyl-tripeptide--D-alanyl-D-alanine ligase
MVKLKGQKINFKINSHQKHDAINSAAAILASNLLGLSAIEIQKIIPELSTSKRRGSISYLNHSSGSKVTIVDDAYNASFESTVSAISSLRNLSLSSPVLILGDMFELGQFSSDEHKKLIPIIEKAKPRLFIGVGRQMSIIGKYLKSNHETLCFKNSDDAKNTIPELIKNNDLILVKGSNGMHLNKITQAINLHFKGFEKNHLFSIKENSYAI